MTSTRRPLHFALLLIGACGDSKGETTGGETTHGSTTSTMTMGTSETTGTTSPGSTSSSQPTDSATSEPEPTSSGTTDADPTEGDPATFAACKASDAIFAELTNFQCGCIVAAGLSPDLASCVAERSDPPDVVDCACTVYARFPGMKEFYACTNPPMASYVDCFISAGCDGADKQEACTEAYYNLPDECPGFPPGTDTPLGVECYGASPFTCGSGEQVPDTYTCDFAPDCMDGSDEVDCDNGFACTNGARIRPEQKCDGYKSCCGLEFECPDKSDEDGCPVVVCDNGQAIPVAFKCDGYVDCDDNSDELGCPQFTCSNGKTIPENLHCDGSDDCLDGSDETHCP